MDATDTGKQPMAGRGSAGRQILLWLGRLVIVGLILTGAGFATTDPVRAAPSARYYSVTGHWVAGDFLTFFDTHGGLDLFGYPRTEAMYTNGRLVQYFQRARFESWPENSPPYNVQLMLIGDAVMGPGDPPVPPPTNGNLYFPETGHSIGGPFLTYFNARGGLAIFGYPTSEALPDSSGFVVQRFQRARFELHPELPTPYQISLGLLGDQYIFNLNQVPYSATLPVSGDAPPTSAPTSAGQLVVQTSPGGDIVVENLDGRNAHVVAQGLDPAWSPDGKKIAFAYWGGDDPGIYVVNADGTNRHKVFTMPFTRDPQWSPDGTQIALYRRYDGFVVVNGVNENDDWFQVMVLNLATGTTSLPPNQETHAYASSWSPDGQSLVFQQYDGLYISKLTGPDLNPHQIPNTNGSFTTPNWSPDGRHILVTYRNHDHWDVGILNTDGSGFHLLTYDPAAPAPSNSAAAAWAPDGSKIIFISDRSGNYTTYSMNPDGSGVTPVNGQPVVYQGQFARVVAWRP